jgi:hypothetical protein
MPYNTFHSSSLFLLTASCWHTIYLLCATFFMLHSLVIHFIYIFFPVHCLLCGSFSCPPFHLSSVWFIPLGSWPPFHVSSLRFIPLGSWPPFHVSSFQFILLCSILSIFLAVHFLSSILSIFFVVHSLDLHFWQSYFFCSDDMFTACNHDPVFF